MSNTVRNVLILVVAVTLGLVIGVFGLGHMGPIPGLVILVAVGFYCYKMLAGNRWETQATPAERTAAMAAMPAAGMATVYVYRDGFVGRALGIDVQVDGAVYVQMKSPRFMMVSLPAGPHTLAAGPRGFAASQAKGGVTEFTLQSGEVVIFKLDMAMGALNNTVLLVREAASPLLLHKLGGMTMVIPTRVPAREAA
jgi:hypothetical protein